MTAKERCEAKRKKPSRYLSRNNPSGWSFQKCGRVAVTKSKFGKLLCASCQAADPFEPNPKT